jgi:hypothetical protein
MVDDDYTDKEDAAPNKAIEFYDCNNGDEDDAGDNDNDAVVDAATGDNNNDGNYRENVTKKEDGRGEVKADDTKEDDEQMQQQKEGT